jgi:hypothetical protein
MARILHTVSRSDIDFETIEIEADTMDECMKVYQELRHEAVVTIAPGLRLSR